MKLPKLFVEKSEYGKLESDESLLSAAAQDPESSTSLRTPHSRRRFFFHSSIALLNLSAGILLGYWCRAISEPSLASFGINPNTPIPREVFTKRHDVPFVADARYIGPSHEVNENWAQLTEGSDSIYISDTSTYGLQDPGIRAPFFIFNDPPPSAKSLANINNFYVLNNLHQLHCVNMIRRRYNTLVYRRESVDPLADTPIDADWITHLEHCFEYLRLSVTCGDYMVFESDSPPGSPEEYWKDGLSWGVVHSCIDWEKLIEFQNEQVALYNSTWN